MKINKKNIATKNESVGGVGRQGQIRGKILASSSNIYRQKIGKDFFLVNRNPKPKPKCKPIAYKTSIFNPYFVLSTCV